MIQCPKCKTKLEFAGSTTINSINKRSNIPTIIKRICNQCYAEFETMEVLREELDYLKKTERLFFLLKIDVKKILSEFEKHEEKL